MRLFVGTSGFAYKEWAGAFYPDDLKADDMLAYYGSKLGAVEINSTFYRIPKDRVLADWAEAVPAEFKFVLKASQRITHRARLRPASFDSLLYLWGQTSALGTKRGPILFQCPPKMKLDLERLKRFVAELPEGMDAAFEFRHPSWESEPVLEVLAERNCALCVTESPESPGEIRNTARWGYFRLRREDYSDQELQAWAQRMLHQPWERVYCFFKHEDVPNAPRLAKRFGQLFAVELLRKLAE